MNAFGARSKKLQQDAFAPSSSVYMRPAPPPSLLHPTSIVRIDSAEEKREKDKGFSTPSLDSNRCPYRRPTFFVLRDCATKAEYRVKGVLPYQFPIELVTMRVELGLLPPSAGSTYSTLPLYGLRRLYYDLVPVKETNASTLFMHIRTLYDSASFMIFDQSPVSKDAQSAWQTFISVWAREKHAPPGGEVKMDDSVVVNGPTPIRLGPSFSFYEWVQREASMEHRWAKSFLESPVLLPYWILSTSPELLYYFPLSRLHEMGVLGRKWLIQQMEDKAKLCDMFLRCIQWDPMSPPMPPISWTFLVTSWPHVQIQDWLRDWCIYMGPRPDLWCMSTFLLDLLQQDLTLSVGHTKHLGILNPSAVIPFLPSSWKASQNTWMACQMEIWAVLQPFLAEQFPRSLLFARTNSKGQDVEYLPPPAFWNWREKHTQVYIDYLLAQSSLSTLSRTAAPAVQRPLLMAARPMAEPSPAMHQQVFVRINFLHMRTKQELRWLYFDFHKSRLPFVPTSPTSDYVYSIQEMQEEYLTLDPSQRKALYLTVTSPVTIEIGTGGSGKTFLGLFYRGRNATFETVSVEDVSPELYDEVFVLQAEKLLEQWEKGGRKGGIPPTLKILKKATILRAAPYNSQKNDLTAAYGQAYTDAKLTTKFHRSPQSFQEEFSEVRFIHLDECGLVDEPTLIDIISCLRSMKSLGRIVFSADPHQLGAFTGGHPFIDLLQSNLFPVMKLTENHRVGEDSRFLFEVVKQTNAGQLDWLSQIMPPTPMPTPIQEGGVPPPLTPLSLLPPLLKAFRVFPATLLGWDVATEGTLSNRMMRLIADYLINNPLSSQAITHSDKMVEWMNRHIMTTQGWYDKNQIRSEFPIGGGKIEQPPYSSIRVGQRVALRKGELEYGLPRSVHERYPHVKAKFQKDKAKVKLGNNEIFLVRDFTVEGKSFMEGKGRSDFLPERKQRSAFALSVPPAGLSKEQTDAFWDEQQPTLMWVQFIDRELQADHSRLDDRALWIPIPWKHMLVTRFEPSYIATTDMIQGKQYAIVIILEESTFTRKRLSTAIGRASQHVWLMNTCLAPHYRSRTVMEATITAVNQQEPPLYTIMQDVIREILEEESGGICKSPHTPKLGEM